MKSDRNHGMLDSCMAVSWILAIAAGVFVASVCVYWLDVHGLVSAVIGLIALLAAGYLFPQVFCTGRDAPPVEPAEPTPAATSAAPVMPEVTPTEPPEKPEDQDRAPKLYGAVPDTVDDLKAISGVSPEQEKKLNDLGIHRYEQIASWKEANIAWVDERLQLREQIERDDWVNQAKKLAKSR